MTLKEVLWDMPDADEYKRYWRDMEGRENDQGLTDPALIPIGCRVVLASTICVVAYWLSGWGN